ncbi:MAG: hypothetical protein KF901_16545 [Myxococcales bacterium]|nr:hypothetical protein [Myxococcales bacterium]
MAPSSVKERPARNPARGPRCVRALALLAVLAGCDDCLPRVRVEQVERLPYPSCPGENADARADEEMLASGYLRAGPTMREKSVTERWSLARRGCHYVLTVHQAWERQLTDVEVVYDDAWRPLRAWKRMAIPGAPPDGRPDVRVYQLEAEPPTMIRRSEDGLEHHRFNGARPVAVIGPGRASVTPWIRASNLEVGEITRGPVLEFRKLVEQITEVALRRDEDRYEPSLGRTVRVYTVFGRESIFTDDEGNVVGDLAGLREHESLESPEPPPLPDYGAPDPRGTP